MIRKDILGSWPIPRLNDVCDYHSSVEEAGTTATRAGVGTLILTHYVPGSPPARSRSGVISRPPSSPAASSSATTCTASRSPLQAERPHPSFLRHPTAVQPRRCRTKAALGWAVTVPSTAQAEARQHRDRGGEEGRTQRPGRAQRAGVGRRPDPHRGRGGRPAGAATDAGDGASAGGGPKSGTASGGRTSWAGLAAGGETVASASTPEVAAVTAPADDVATVPKPVATGRVVVVVGRAAGTVVVGAPSEVERSVSPEVTAQPRSLGAEGAAAVSPSARAALEDQRRAGQQRAKDRTMHVAPPRATAVARIRR